jgi:hypothetical protein
MAAITTSTVLGTPAPQFRLPATDTQWYTLRDIHGGKGLVIVFICNHYPYVKAVIDRLVEDGKVLMAQGVSFAAICSSDAKSYPEDSLDNMQHFAKAHGFPFPYFTTQCSRSLGPMARSVHPIISVTTRIASCNIVAVSTRGARRRRRQTLAAYWPTPCLQSRPPARGRSTRYLRSAAPSNGSRCSARQFCANGCSLSNSSSRAATRQRSDDHYLDRSNR